MTCRWRIPKPDLLNRALDKPAEHEPAVKLSGRLEIAWQDE
jgi:hypothetical protein